MGLGRGEEMMKGFCFCSISLFLKCAATKMYQFRRIIFIFFWIKFRRIIMVKRRNPCNAVGCIYHIKIILYMNMYIDLNNFIIISIKNNKLVIHLV